VRWYIKPPFDGTFTQQYLYQKLLESDNYILLKLSLVVGWYPLLRHSVFIVAQVTRAPQLLRWATFGHNRHWPKSGAYATFLEGELGSHLIQCRLGYRPTSLPPSSRLATTDMGQKLGMGAVPLLGEAQATLC